MSRIEKAIEIAAQKRGQQKHDRLETKPIPIPEANSLKDMQPPSGELTASVSNPYLVTVNDPTSPASEQYRKLKSLIINLSQAGSFDKAFMVTSSETGEGKTITALNLAITRSCWSTPMSGDLP